MDKMKRFLQERIIGKEMYTDELIYSLEDGALEGVYSDRIIFSNLVQTNFGINYDMFLSANEIVYELNSDRQRAAVRSNHNGISVFRYELSKRKSTGEITGIFRLITTTNQNQTAQAIVCSVFDVEIEDEEMRWKEEQALYRDQSSVGNKFHAVAFDSKNRFYFEEKKARFAYDGTCYDIDTETFSKTVSKDVFPCFLAKEK